jgi:carbon storage regulator CsrA
MLVLSRKPGERLVVPHCDLVVTVIAIEGKAVRPGISAPEALAVYREGVWQRLCQEHHGQQRQTPGPKLDSQRSHPS